MSVAAIDTAASSRGITLILLANLCFAGMDAVSKTLIVDYPIGQILWVRYAFFAGFATMLSLRSGGPLAGFRTERPVLNVLRAVLLVAEIACFVLAFRFLPLADTHAVAAVYPLLITALSALVLGEAVGPRRWAAVAVGFLGVVVILRPGLGVFNPATLIPLLGASLFAVYQILTKIVARRDGMTTLLMYTGWVGFALTSFVGPLQWAPPDLKGWILLPIAGATGVIGHLTLIRALEAAPASVLQPFNYTLLVWATVVGFVVFGDLPDGITIAGAGIVVASGLYTWWRERVRARQR